MVRDTRALTGFRDLSRFMDGADAGSDCRAPMEAALSEGPGVVYVPPGVYRMGGVTLPPGVAVVGAGRSTVISSNGAPAVFSLSGCREWAVRDLVLDGGARGDWKARQDLGRAGILIDACVDYDVTNVTVRNFDGAGIQCLNTTTFCPRGSIDRVAAYANYCGVRFDFRGEYINASGFSCENNVYGCVIHAGNVRLASSIFSCNTYGLYVEDKENGSHGAISNCLVNHNDFPLVCRGVRIGLAIQGCSFFCGTMLLEESVGVDISSGILSCSVRTVGPGANRFAGNFMRLRDVCTFDLSPSTIVEGNFTESGPWMPPAAYHTPDSPKRRMT